MNKKLKISEISIILIPSIVLTVFFFYFVNWSPFTENGNYWYRSKFFLEKGEFAVLGRAPLYSFYLGNLKNIFGVGLAIYVEFFIHCFFGTYLLLFVFYKETKILWLSILTLLTVVPNALYHDPILQWYSSLFIIAALTLGSNTQSQLIFTTLASSFRTTFIFFMLLPIYQILKDRKIKIFHILTLLIIGVLFFCFNKFQSQHPRNNAQGVETKWFPGNSKSLSDASFIQNVDYIYSIKNKLGDTDFFFTHKERFGDANNMLEMIVTNPKIIIDHLMYNIYHFPIVFINQTVFENLLRPFIGKYAKLIMALLFVLVIISVLKYKLLNGEEIFCLTLSFLVTFAMVLAKVKSGYFSFFFIILVYYSLKIIKKNRVIGFLSLALIVPNPTNSISFHKKDLHRQIIYDIPQAIKFVNNFDRILTKNNCEKILIYDQLKRRMIELLSENDSRFFSTIFSLPPFKKPIELPRCIYIGDVAYTNLKYPSYSTNSNIRFKIHLLPVISKVPKEDIHSFQDGKFYFIKKIESQKEKILRIKK